MADERNKRGMEDALLRLVTALLPEIHDEDDEAFTERRNGTFEGAKNELLSVCLFSVRSCQGVVDGI